MNTLKTTITFLLFFLCLSSFSQVKEVKEANKTAKEANEQVKDLDTTLQTTQQTVTSLKNTLTGFFGSKGKNETIIEFSGIEFGDNNLSLLLNEFRGMKGVKDISKNLDQGTVYFKVNSKKGTVHLWENLPGNLKDLFKILAANEEGMLVQYSENSGTGEVNQRVTKID